jgi:uncharacterized protein YegL
MAKLPDPAEFAKNPSQRCPVMLLIDTSGSMANERIDAVNAGLGTLKQYLAKDPVASISVEIAVMTFDSEVTLAHPFGIVQEFTPPTLTAQHQTFLGAAITKALDAIAERKQKYKDGGVPYYRPLLFILTDGNPEGEIPTVIDDAQQRLADATQKKQVEVFPIGIGDGVDLSILTRICGKQAIRLDEAKWDELFKWMSKSVQIVSQSAGAGHQAALPVPGWATMSTN